MSAKVTGTPKKASSNKRVTNKDSDIDSVDADTWYEKTIWLLVKVFIQVGPVGYVLIVITVFVFTKATPVKAEEIIDMWILFKTQGQVGTLFGTSAVFNVPATIVVSLLLLLLVIQQFHYARLMKLKDARIEEIAELKSLLQQGKLPPLSSSK